ncbi:hypothetical protein [Salinispora arenicola]|uniref:hypothetical protein n=1 Tax=Salinispora arenicola TaxID=168697 RepID=UPI00035F1A4E|nr:hypothetical protein [Salinispora arenicola]
MPLWVNEKHGERKRTVPGSYEDRRLAAAGEWTLVPAAGQDAPVAEQSSAAAPRRTSRQ